MLKMRPELSAIRRCIRKWRRHPTQSNVILFSLPAYISRNNVLMITFLYPHYWMSPFSMIISIKETHSLKPKSVFFTLHLRPVQTNPLIRHQMKWIHAIQASVISKRLLCSCGLKFINFSSSKLHESANIAFHFDSGITIGSMWGSLGFFNSTFGPRRIAIWSKMSISADVSVNNLVTTNWLSFHVTDFPFEFFVGTRRGTGDKCIAANLFGWKRRNQVWNKLVGMECRGNSTCVQWFVRWNHSTACCHRIWFCVANLANRCHHQTDQNRPSTLAYDHPIWHSAEVQIQKWIM